MLGSEFPVLWIDCSGSGPSGVDSIRDSISILGYLMDKREEVVRYQDWHERYVNEVSSRTSQIPEEDRVRFYLEIRWVLSRGPGGRRTSPAARASRLPAMAEVHLVLFSGRNAETPPQTFAFFRAAISCSYARRAFSRGSGTSRPSRRAVSSQSSMANFPSFRDSSSVSPKAEQLGSSGTIASSPHTLSRLNY
jgi:hypothetical protein